MDKLEKEKYFMIADNLIRKKAPDGSELRIFRRQKVEKNPEIAVDIITEEIEYGVGEFFYDESGNITSYDDTSPVLHDRNLEDLILDIERMYGATKKPLLVIENIPYTENGYVKILAKETRASYNRRKNYEKRLKGKKKEPKRHE